MKTVLMAVLVAVVSVFMLSCMVGCLTQEQQRRVDENTARLVEKLKELEKYEDIAKEIKAKLAAGTLTSGEGEIVYENLREDIEEGVEAARGFRDEINRIRAEGASGIDLVTGTILSLFQTLVNLGIVRVWRGSVNARAGDIGVRTTT